MSHTEHLSAVGPNGEACTISRVWSEIDTSSLAGTSTARGLSSYFGPSGERLNPTPVPRVFETLDRTRWFTLGDVGAVREILPTDLKTAAQHAAVRGAPRFATVHGVDAAVIAQLRDLGVLTNDEEPPALTEAGRRLQWTLSMGRLVS
jgi:hypothetical protein